MFNRNNFLIQNGYKTYITQNGTKICYKKATGTLFDVYFNGGFLTKNKQVYELPHLVEHSIYLSPAIDNLKNFGVIPENAVTVPDYTAYFYSIDIPFKKLRLSSYKAYKKQFQNAVESISDTIKSNDITISKLENEKKVIEKEYIEDIAGAGTRSFDRFFMEYCRDNLRNIGSGENALSHTMENVTIEDVAKFKTENYTQENLMIFVYSPLNFEDILPIIEEKFINKMPSNKKTKHIIEDAPTLENSKYYCYKCSDDECRVLIDTVVTTNGDLPRSAKLLVNDMFKEYCRMGCLSNSTTKLIESFRNEGLVYSVRGVEDFYFGNNVGEIIGVITSEEDMRKAILKIPRFYNEAFFAMTSDEFIEAYIKSIFFNGRESEIVDLLAQEEETLYKMNGNIDFDEEFIFMQIGHMLNHLNCDHEAIKKLIREAQKELIINVVVEGNIKLSHLPDIKFVEDVLRGECKEFANYRHNMQCYANYYDYVENIKTTSNKTVSTQALVVCEENNK